MKPKLKGKREAVLGIALIATLLLAPPVARRATAAAHEVTAANVAQKIAGATTAEDHQALASYYTEQAAAAAANVKEHEAMLASYEKAGGKPFANMKPHCRSLISSYKAEQKEYEAMAELHAKEAAALTK